MGNIFRYDSPVMRFMMLITNLICLNALWILCSIPVVTAGAATTAMYYVIFQYITGQDDAVVKPFFRAFRENFRGVTPVWILNLLIGAALAAEFFYLSRGGEVWLKVVFGIVLFVYGGASAWLYPILARYDTKPKSAVWNSFALSTRHLLSTAIAVALNALPAVLAVLRPEVLYRFGIVWLIGGFSLSAYLIARIMMLVFKKHDRTPSQE